MHERSAETDTALLDNKPLTIKSNSKVNLEGVGVVKKEPIKKETSKIEEDKNFDEKKKDISVNLKETKTQSSDKK